MSIRTILLILTSVAASNVRGQEMETNYDYDVNLRIEGSLLCKGCSAQAVAEISLVRTDGRPQSSGVLMDKLFIASNERLDVTKNYAWGQRNNGTQAEKVVLSVFIHMPGCDSYQSKFSLDELPFEDNRFTIDLGDVPLKCG